MEAHGARWLASALAQPRAGVTLFDAEPMARRLAAALSAQGARAGYPLRLEVSRLELADPADGARWLFLGSARGFPVPSDAITSDAGDAGGVTLTVAQRAGTCDTVWNALRLSLASEGTQVDRPGYVPQAFGSRIRRISAGDRMREFYCARAAAGALVVTAVFRGSDGEAMSRMAPMLRALVRAAPPPDASRAEAHEP
jgi:hypothetical protein